MTLMEQKVRSYKENVAGLIGTLPDAAQAYNRFTEECFAAGELDERTKQLIALGIALFANNEVCTYYHVQEAQAKGATDRQIMETAAVAGAALSGHVFSQGVTRVQGALERQPQHTGWDSHRDVEFAEEMTTWVEAPPSY